MLPPEVENISNMGFNSPVGKRIDQGTKLLIPTQYEQFWQHLIKANFGVVGSVSQFSRSNMY